MISFYEAFGIPEDADQDAIKAAYKDLMRRWHPDRNPGDKEAEETAKAASHIFSTLMDPRKRQAYDRKLIARRRPVQPGFTIVFTTCRWDMTSSSTTNGTWGVGGI